MEGAKQAAQGSAATARKSTRYTDMKPRQKVVFILKLVVCILSFGFIFPSVNSD